MISPRIRLEGRFVEAFLYYDFLWLLTADGEIWAFDTTAYLTDKLGADAEQAIMAFARNDRLPRGTRDAVDPHFKSDLIRRIGSQSLDLTIADVQSYSRIFKSGNAAAKSILDFRCYYGRGFVATDMDVFQLRMLGRSDLEHVHIGGRGNGALGGQKVADFRCRQFRTNFGMVSAAAGPDGAWYASGLLSDDSAWRAHFQKFAEKSTATEVMGGAMTNIAGPNEIAVFETDIHPLFPGPSLPTVEVARQQLAQRSSLPLVEDERQQQEISKVVGLNQDVTTPLRQVMERTQSEEKIVFKRVFLSKSKVFAVDQRQRLHAITLVSKNLLQMPTFTSTFPAAPGSVLSITFTAGGKTVAELDDEVCIVDFYRKTWDRIFEGEVYSVRGYPGSKWYQNLLTLVGDDRVELTFVT